MISRLLLTDMLEEGILLEIARSAPPPRDVVRSYRYMLKWDASSKISEFCISGDSQVSVSAIICAEQVSIADDNESCLLTILRALVNMTDSCASGRPLPLS